MKELSHRELAALGGWRGRSAPAAVGDRPFSAGMPPVTSRTRERVEAKLTAQAPVGPPPGAQLLPRLLTGIDYGKGLEVKLAIGAARSLGMLRLTKKF